MVFAEGTSRWWTKGELYNVRFTRKLAVTLRRNTFSTIMSTAASVSTARRSQTRKRVANEDATYIGPSSVRQAAIEGVKRRRLVAEPANDPEPSENSISMVRSYALFFSFLLMLFCAASWISRVPSCIAISTITTLSL